LKLLQVSTKEGREGDGRDRDGDEGDNMVEGGEGTEKKSKPWGA